VTLTLTYWGGDVDTTTWQQRLALAKEKFPNITVNAQIIPTDYDTKLQTMFAGGTAPDIAEVSQDDFDNFASQGEFEDLNPYFQQAGIDLVSQFGQGNIDTFTEDGHLYGIADRSGAMVIWYNKDLFDQAGVSYPTADWTWDQFRTAAKQLTQRDASGNVTVWGWWGNLDWWPLWAQWMAQNGGGILDASGQPILNSQANIDGLQFMQDMVYQDKTGPSPLDYANMGVTSPDTVFAQGKMAMEVTGFWNVAQLESTSVNYDIAPLPQGKVKAVPVSVAGLAMSSSCQHKAEAAELLEFLTSAAGQKPIADNALDVPSNIQALQDPSWTNPSWNTRGIDLGVYAEEAPYLWSPPTLKFDQIVQAFSNAMTDTWSNNQSVTDGLNAAQQAVQDLLKG